jgi:exopolysaccharide biosynthesis polyprenyl glycosylphosphotransferase
LTIRYGHLPGRELLLQHLIPSFFILIATFIVVNIIVGLYDKQAVYFRWKIHRLLAKAQFVNAFIGIAFFYFAPVSISPRANFFIFFVISTIFLFVWRILMFPILSQTEIEQAILIGKSQDIDDLYNEINTRSRYGLHFVCKINPDQDIGLLVNTNLNNNLDKKITTIVADLHNSEVQNTLKMFYKLILNGVKIVDASRLYENIFDRIPVSTISDRWIIENSGSIFGKRRIFDIAKRIMDIVLSLIVGLFSLFLYPFVILLIKIQDGGPIFVVQERVGQNGKMIKIRKFRSMTSDDSGKYGSSGKTQNKVTKIGKILRKTSIDELPQIWSVFLGDLSLIGPRPELPDLTQIYEKEIGYYNVRHLIKPGLSGWAQIYHENHPHHSVRTEDTRDKLSYDLFYIKNRSFAIDLAVVLKTIKVLFKGI